MSTNDISSSDALGIRHRSGRLIAAFALIYAISYLIARIPAPVPMAVLLIKIFILPLAFGWYVKMACNLGRSGLIIASAAIPLIPLITIFFKSGALEDQARKHPSTFILIAIPSVVLWILISSVGWHFALRPDEVASRNTSRRFLLATALLISSAAGIVGWATAVSFPRWQTWHRQGASLRIGMSQDEVIAELKRHSSKVSCGNEEGDFCQYEPGGLSRWSLSSLTNGLFYFPFTYRVELKFDGNGKLKTWESRTFSD